MAAAVHPARSRKGRTPTGYVFQVPETTDMFLTLLSPRKWGPAELLTIFFILLQTLTLPFVSILPTSFYIAVFAFWRASYNIGLAWLLHIQSHHSAVTKSVQSCSPSARALINWAATKSMPHGYKWHHYPPSFNAWLAFRALSMVVLSNDGFSYILVAASCFNPLTNTSYLRLAFCLSLGAALFALSFWSKAAAHHVLGDFAWYWGDFFFTVDGDLTFDGVFELFPHPMYTVGYAAYYGAALICRSYCLLAVSLVAHIAQLLFLALVEEPHIQKIYSSAPVSSPSQSSEPQNRHSASHNSEPQQKRQEFTAATPPRPVLGALMFVVLIVLILSASARPSASVTISLLVSCRVLYWAAITYFLRAPTHPTTKNRWLQRCLSRGYTISEAYSSWQYVLLSAYMVNHVLFLTATVLFGSSLFHGTNFAKASSLLLSGSTLITIALIAQFSSWKTIGSFGFFYGDFFVDPAQRELKSSGSFRYVTNPQATLGYLAYYGLALMRQSRSLLLLAALCQCMELAFTHLVESRHIRTNYKPSTRTTALEKATAELPLISCIMRHLPRMASQAINTVEDVKTKHAPTLKREMAVRKERLEANLSKSFAKARDQHFDKRTQELRTRAKSMVSELNWDHLVSALENRGIIVERVSQPITEPGLVTATG